MIAKLPSRVTILTRVTSSCSTALIDFFANTYSWQAISYFHYLSLLADICRDILTSRCFFSLCVGYQWQSFIYAKIPIPFFIIKWPFYGTVDLKWDMFSLINRHLLLPFHRNTTFGGWLMHSGSGAALVLPAFVDYILSNITWEMFLIFSSGARVNGWAWRDLAWPCYCMS